jgi:hypothetical protein
MVLHTHSTFRVADCIADRIAVSRYLKQGGMVFGRENQL